MQSISKTIPMVLALAGVLVGGCDAYDFLPITAKEAGMPTAKLSVASGTIGLEYLPDGVGDVEIEVSDVWIHRADDDAWIPIHAGNVVMTLADAGGSVSLGTVYVPEGTYDQVTMQLESMHVLTNATKMGVFVEDPELSWGREFEVTDDGRLRIDVDVSRALREEAPGWVGAPGLVVDLQQ